jgi:hypothetical protein
MIAVTHNGLIEDIAYILPICSWLEKTKNEKILFVLPKTTPDIETIIPLLKIQKFTHDIRLIEYPKSVFDPNEFITDIKLSTYYNFIKPIKEPKYITDFQADIMNLGVDRDFVLNLDLEFKYASDKLSITPGLKDVFPNYPIVYDNGDMLTTLRELAYSKERHVNFNTTAIYLGLTKIPYYLYLFKKESGFYIDENKENFWLKLRDASILDVRAFGSSRNIISIYDKIYFNQ